MLEFEPPWWLVLILGAALPKLWDAAVRIAPRLMEHTRGGLRRWWRGRKMKGLRRIRPLRFDSAAITRETVKSYAMMMLFILSGMFYGIGLLVMPGALKQTDAGLTFWGTATGLPMLIFEVLWLLSMEKVDGLLHHRSKIKRRGMRLY